MKFNLNLVATAKGYSQVSGRTLTEIFSLVIELKIDASRIYLTKRTDNFVCYLKRNLYCLKHSGREWNKCCDTFVRQYVLLHLKNDPCIYHCSEKVSNSILYQ